MQNSKGTSAKSRYEDEQRRKRQHLREELRHGTDTDCPEAALDEMMAQVRRDIGRLRNRIRRGEDDDTGCLSARLGDLLERDRRLRRERMGARPGSYVDCLNHPDPAVRARAGRARRDRVRQQGVEAGTAPGEASE